MHRVLAHSSAENVGSCPAAITIRCTHCRTRGHELAAGRGTDIHVPRTKTVKVVLPVPQCCATVRSTSAPSHLARVRRKDAHQGSGMPGPRKVSLLGQWAGGSLAFLHVSSSSGQSIRSALLRALRAAGGSRRRRLATSHVRLFKVRWVLSGTTQSICFARR